MSSPQPNLKRRELLKSSSQRKIHEAFVGEYLAEAKAVLDALDVNAIERVVQHLGQTRERRGRVFILGVGGSAANASHAVNDFRRIAGIEAYAPTDNVADLTARTNDEGWANVFQLWLADSCLCAADAIFVLSVGGGSIANNVTPNLVAALDFARSVGATILGIAGRDGGYTAAVADACIVVPTVNAARITPHVEASQGVLWHLLVSHPALQRTPMKWESLAEKPSVALSLNHRNLLHPPVTRKSRMLPRNLRASSRERSRSTKTL